MGVFWCGVTGTVSEYGHGICARYSRAVVRRVRIAIPDLDIGELRTDRKGVGIITCVFEAIFSSDVTIAATDFESTMFGGLVNTPRLSKNQ